MRLKHLLFKTWVTMIVFGFVGLAAYGQATLKHAYTFEDGTANDTVGEAHGSLEGGAFIEDGLLNLEGESFCALPGKKIGINEYNGATVEVVFNQSADLDNVWAMLWGFGRTGTTSGAEYGIDYWMFQGIRQDDSTRIMISCNNETNPWSTEDGCNIAEINDDYLHVITCVITSTDMSIYLDGKFMRSTELSIADNRLENVSNDTAYIGGMLYQNGADAHWEGVVDGLFVWDGALDEQTIFERRIELLGDAFFDATLVDIQVSEGTIDPEFSVDNDVYQVTVPYGTPYITLEAFPNVRGAQVTITDGLGMQVGKDDGIIKIGNDGIDLGINVTALNGTSKKTYYVQVVTGPKNETSILKDIELSAGALLTDFNQSDSSYMASIPIGATSVDVTPVKAWEGQTVTGGGTINLTDGVGTTTIEVTSENGENSMTYNLEIHATRPVVNEDYFIKLEDEDLVIGEGGADVNLPLLFIPLKDEPTQLMHIEESGVEGQYFILSKTGNYFQVADPGVANAWNFYFADSLPNDLDTARFILNEFEPGRFTIKPVAKPDGDYVGINSGENSAGYGVFNDKPEGGDNDPYYWNILTPLDVVDPYDTYLDTLYIDGIGLNPLFAYSTYEYTVVLPADVTSLTIGGAARDEAGTTVTGMGTVNTPDARGSVTVKVTSDVDGTYSHEYTIHYLRETPLTLKHSYTFADGTGKDVVGGADGEVRGGDITDGIFTSEVEGDYIVLPAADIALNEYPAITFETWITSGVNDGYAMITYFGALSGANCVWLQPARASDGDPADVTRLQIATNGNTVNTNADEPAEGDSSYFVGVITYDSIFLYLDGELASSAANETAVIAGIDTTNGWIAYGGYSDPTWLGSIYEFNIYTGVMDSATVKNRYDAGFAIEDSTTIATLDSVTLDDVTFEEFESFIFDYDVVLPKGTTAVPTVAGFAKNAKAGVVVTDADAIPGSATIVVTSEKGGNTVTYNINFSIEVSKDATLSDLTVDGTTITGFDTEVLDYKITLEAGTTEIPVIDAVPTDENASYAVTPADALPGTTTVVVTAEDGETEITYTIEFELNVSPDATLSDLTVNGTTIEGFSPDKTQYIVLLPKGSSVPTVVGTPNFSGAGVVVTDATAIPGATTVKVTAEDGVNEKIYTVNFDYIIGINGNEVSIAKVYPSISNGTFVVETTGQHSKVVVYDFTGKVVLKQELTNSINNITLSQEGMYMVKVEAEGIINMFKVFKIK